jgi:hypothetical protein
MPSRVYLQVPFEEKDSAKDRGARWDKIRKLWYVEAGWDLAPLIEKWNVYLDCPFAQKDQAKAKGARFDPEKKLWYVRAGARNLEEFSKWLPLGSIRSTPSSSSAASSSSSAASTSSSEAHIIPCSPPKNGSPAKKRKISSSLKMNNYFKSLPHDFLCPIEMELMDDPVVCADGFTYERSAIKTWLRRNNTSPKTNERLANKDLIPNKTLKAVMDHWIESRDQFL